MKKPPCMKDGKPCEKRHVGYQGQCKDMADWQVEHQLEKERERAFLARLTPNEGHKRYIKMRVKEMKSKGGGKKL